MSIGAANPISREPAPVRRRWLRRLLIGVSVLALGASAALAYADLRADEVPDRQAKSHIPTSHFEGY